MKNKVDYSKVKVKKDSGFKHGRGYSLGELKEANLSLHQANVLHLPVDKRRKSTHPANVENLKKGK